MRQTSSPTLDRPRLRRRNAATAKAATAKAATASTAAAALLLAMSMQACGFKTTPRPPEDTAPVVSTALRAAGVEGGVRLSWGRAEESVDGRPLYDLASFSVERSTDGSPFAAIASIPVSDRDRVRKQAEFSYVDTQAPPGASLYRVRAVTDDGQLGPPTEPVAAGLAPAAAPAAEPAAAEPPGQ